MVFLGKASPVSICFDKVSKTSRLQTKFSSIIEGTSKKSCSTPPGHGTADHAQACIECLDFESTQCMTWPNSWKNVSTSRNLNKLGLVGSVERDKFPILTISKWILRMNSRGVYELHLLGDLQTIFLSAVFVDTIQSTQWNWEIEAKKYMIPKLSV